MATNEEIVFDGIVFRRYPNSKKREHRVYYRSSGLNGTSLSLHRYKYEKEIGPIPEGFHVHHVDGNQLNNDISNLQAVPEFDHLYKHAKELSNDSEHVRCILDSLRLAQERASDWHRSENGRKWHSEMQKKVWNIRAFKKHTCIKCGEVFESNSTRPPKFCSNNCKSAWRKSAGLDNEERTCTICGVKMISNKYSTKCTCSPECENKKRAATMNANGTNAGPKRKSAYD